MKNIKIIADYKELFDKEILLNAQLREELSSKTKKLEECTEKINSALIGVELGYIGTIHRLATMAEFKDEDTGAHIKRISLYSKELADEIGMNQDFLHSIYYSSPMHDIGKVGIPDAILTKPGPCTPAEFNVIKTHTTIGAKILQKSVSQFLIMAEQIALSHHERWDGSGYPNGAKGEEIPLAARIVSIVDQYDAIRSKRPYKQAISHPKVFKVLTSGDGRTLPRHFDPQVLEGFRRLHERFEEIYESHVGTGNLETADF